MRYRQMHDGEWCKPKRKYYLMACCDCGLVHRVEFSLLKKGKRAYIFMRAWRDKRRTAAMRRGKKHNDG